MPSHVTAPAGYRKQIRNVPPRGVIRVPTAVVFRGGGETRRGHGQCNTRFMLVNRYGCHNIAVLNPTPAERLSQATPRLLPPPMFAFYRRRDWTARTRLSMLSQHRGEVDTNTILRQFMFSMVCAGIFARTRALSVFSLEDLRTS